ncbi:hypothetical protein V8C26DRAFT_393176 [Trichoderma gracile]
MNTMPRLMPYIIAFAAALITLGFRVYQSKTSMSTIKHPHDSEIFVNPPSCAKTEEERFRVSFGVEPGAVVNGWPSKGGVYILENCLGVDLDFLKLDRFQKTRQPPQSGPEAAAEEEAHCNRMRQLGAVWWESEEEWVEHKVGAPSNPSMRPRFIKVGWPAGGGVWVLDITDHEAWLKGAGLIYTAYNMEERCRLIEQLGGVFYENPKDWLDVELP